MGSTDNTSTERMIGISRECSPLNCPSARGSVLLDAVCASNDLWLIPGEYEPALPAPEKLATAFSAAVRFLTSSF